MKSDSIATIVRTLETTGAIKIRGMGSLMAAQQVLSQLAKAANAEIVFDPKSDPGLVDLLAVPLTLALQDALIGAGLGAIVGLLLGQPSQGASLGLRIGMIAGAIRGVNSVQQGWRVRARLLPNGEAEITIRAKGKLPWRKS
jgi:hypothetical protein